MLRKDGLVVREIKRHTEDKLDILRRYSDTFLLALKKPAPPKYYLDLFSGPGICFNTDTNREIDGSPFIAIKIGESLYGFERYIFVDIEKENIDALRNRIESRFPNVLQRIIYINGDCNNVSREIHSYLPQYSFTLAFVDPEGLDVNFNTISKITDDRNVDLIVNFPIGMAAKRNIHKFIKKEESKLAAFLGTNKWRENIASTQDKVIITQLLANIYCEQLKSLGYKYVEPFSDMELVRSTEKSVPLYYLVFASKHPMGHELWRKITSRKSDGKRSIF